MVAHLYDGHGGWLSLRKNPEAQLKRVELLEAKYGECSALAKENAKRFYAEKAVARLLEIIRSIPR